MLTSNYEYTLFFFFLLSPASHTWGVCVWVCISFDNEKYVLVEIKIKLFRKLNSFVCHRLIYVLMNFVLNSKLYFMHHLFQQITKASMSQAFVQNVNRRKEKNKEEEFR